MRAETSLVSLAYVLKSPLLSEKAARAGDKENVVAFWVDVKATKHDIKKAVEAFFPNVKVLSVSTAVMPRIRAQFGKVQGQTKKRKKAYVKLEKGNQINFQELN